LNFSFDLFSTPMLNISIAILAGVVLISLLARYLPEVPIFRGLFLSSKLASGSSLDPVVSDIGIAFPIKVGDSGEAITTLRPSGKARIGEETFDVLTEGEFLESGTRIRVRAVTGSGIIVGRLS
jgi:membrane-bound serine protease (ClpP class)